MWTAGARGASHFAPDPWLAQTMSRPVFRLASSGAEDGRALASEMQQLAERGDAFFYAKLPTTDIASCLSLARAGFRVIDTGITFTWKGGNREPLPGVSVDLVRADQHDAVLTIAETSFRYSRFHLDPQVPATLANLVKRRWIENYLLGKRGSGLYAAEVRGAVAGFLAVIEARAHDRPVAVIDLIAVGLGAQGHGVGSALVQRFVRDWGDRASELRVGTQAANIRSLRFYEDNGFRIADSNYVLHAHYCHGEVCQ